MNSVKISLLLFCIGGTALAAEHNRSTGQVLDANMTQNILQTGATYSANSFGSATATTSGSFSGDRVNATTNASGRSTTYGNVNVQHTKLEENHVIIRGGDYLYAVDDTTQKAVGLPTQGYLARSIANRKHGCRVIIGDSIQYEQAKDKLFVQDADGKVCKLDIVRQERIAPAQNPAAAR